MLEWKERMLVGKPRTVNGHGFDRAHAASRRSGVDLVARPRIRLLRPRIRLLRPANRTWGPEIQCSGLPDDCSRPVIVPAAGESPARRAIRSLPPARRSLRGGSGRSASGPVCSAVRLPAPAMAGVCAARIVRSVRRPAEFGGPGACSNARLLSSASKTPAEESIRRLKEPECRRWRRPVRPALDPCAPEPGSACRDPTRCLPNPICRLRRRNRQWPKRHRLVRVRT